MRDWIVLAALTAEPRRTQLALAHDLGLDKTTLQPRSWTGWKPAASSSAASIRTTGGRASPS